MPADRGPLPMGDGPRVCVYTRRGCHLCDEALAVVERVCAERGEQWVGVDVDTDPALVAAYTDHVPVTVVDGRRIGMWFLDDATLREALDQGRTETP